MDSASAVVPDPVSVVAPDLDGAEVLESEWARVWDAERGTDQVKD